MPEQPSSGRWSRESRLLLLTVAVCAAVLLLLARLRFPDAAPVEVATAPLERLAARASYDALAADVQRIEPTIAAHLTVLRVVPRVPAGPYDVWDALAGSQALGGVRHVVALRTSVDTAIAPIDARSRIDGIVGDDGSAVAVVLGTDPVRGWAYVRVPDAPVPPLRPRPVSALPTPIYVVVAEGTEAGATIRPVFLGQSTRFDSLRWSEPLLPLGGMAISPGALLFTLEGDFVGAVVVEGGAPAVVGPRDLFDTAARLAETQHGTVADLGVSLQRLSAELAAATGVHRGVVVADVDPDGPASAALAPGDIITGLGDRSVDDPDAFLLDVAQRRVGETVSVAYVRAGEPTATMLTLRAAMHGDEAQAVSLVREPRVGVRVERGGRQLVPGLRPGDIITRAGDTSSPTPPQVRALLAQPSATGFLTMVVQRDGRQQVIAVPVSAGSDAAPR